MTREIDLYLISRTMGKDSIGQQIPVETKSELLFATQHGITRAEWSMAAQNGLNPEMMVRLRDSDDYNDEDVAEINGTRYSIYRTYLRDDGGIELYLRKIVGA